MDDRISQTRAELKPASRPVHATSTLGSRQPGKVTSHAVTCWHALLCAIAVLNLALWALSAVAVTHGQVATGVQSGAACQMQLLLSALYVLACAFRSVLPVYDAPRIVLVNSRLSSVMVGRSVATAGELCFAAQWALILYRIALLTDSSLGKAVSLAIVPLIVLAEVCSWHAVLTTEQRGHVLENSIWGLSAALVIVSFLMIGPHRVAELYPTIIGWCAGGIAYVLFMVLFDVPMYWSRWLSDQRAGRQYLSVAQGAVDLARRRVVSRRWEDWKTEILWMSLYFTFGVWSSVSIVYACLTMGQQH